MPTLRLIRLGFGGVQTLWGLQGIVAGGNRLRMFVAKLGKKGIDCWSIVRVFVFLIFSLAN